MQHHAATLPTGYPATPRRRLCINDGWRFALNGPRSGDHDGAALSRPGADVSGWEPVTVPHGLRLTSLDLDGCDDDKAQPTFLRDVGWYRRAFTVDPTGGERVVLEFEGVHQVTDVWVNGHHAGTHDLGGYTPFHFDVTQWVNRDADGTDETNVVVVRADNTRRPDVPPDPGPFDYVKFAGLYRDVYLVQTHGTRVTFPWEKTLAGVCVTTPSVKDDSATVTVRTTVRTDEGGRVELYTRLIDADGRVVERLRSAADVAAGTERTFTQTGGIGTYDDPVRKWSPDRPYLYRVLATVFVDGEAVDAVEQPLGVSTIELRPGTGVLINGEPTMLIGVNRHQQFAYVGDAAPNGLHRQDAWQFKQWGINLVRLAHYPHDDAFLEACDELGLLVYEEPPSWIQLEDEPWRAKLETVARRMVRNHRNHPCVFAWGAGINHRGTIERLHYAAKEEDPTRLTGSNHAPWTGDQTAGVADFFTQMDYHHIPEPSEPMFANEHRSDDDGTANRTLVSRYRASGNRFAMAAWTAHAYYTFHPANAGQECWQGRTRGGMTDIFRRPRPVVDWYRSELIPVEREPVVAIADRWVPGTTRVRVFSNAPRVALAVDGQTIAERGPDDDHDLRHLNAPGFTFPVVFTPGELTASALSQDGVVLASAHTRTPGAAARLNLTADLDGRVWHADGSDVVCVFAEVTDTDGQVVHDAAADITLSVDGDAAVVGDASIGANPYAAYDGVAGFLVRAGARPGPVTLRASAAGLDGAELTLSAEPVTRDDLARRARPVRDFPAHRVDLGGARQHVQPGWTGWTHDADTGAPAKLDLGAGASAALTAEGDATLRWFGVSNTPGPLSFVCEDAVMAVAGPDAGLRLTFRGLAPGRYALKTLHHAREHQTDVMDVIDDAVADGVAEPADVLHVRSPAGAAAAEQTAGPRVPSAGPGHGAWTFDVPDDACEPVAFIFTSPEPGRELWLNGFVLERRD